MRMKQLRIAVVILVAGTSAACATTQATAPVNGLPLAVPPAPERVLEMLPMPAAAEAPGEEPSTATAPATELQQVPAPVLRPVPSEPASAAAPESAAAPSPPRDLRAPTPAGDVATIRRVRDHLDQASRALRRVVYETLTSPERLQYEQARRFSQQAEEARTGGNLVFAETLAEKASTLALALPAP